MDTPEAITKLAHIPERATAAACFGTHATSGERTIIPVAEVQYGLGIGWGGSTEHREMGSGGGGGGGSRVRGVAVVEVAPDGVRVHPIVDQTSITLAALAFASAAFAISARALQKLIRG